MRIAGLLTGQFPAYLRDGELPAHFTLRYKIVDHNGSDEQQQAEHANDE